jgi:putative nucleotidyltransferase with HDIG domain
MNRDKAFSILTKYNTNKRLIAHAVAVEAVMKHFATLYNEDVNYWGNIGLLHDVDYELYPDEHCKKCVEILTKEGVGAQEIRSIQSHGYGLCCDIEPVSIMEKVLYAIDELTGLIIATALMKPNKKLSEVDVDSVVRKWDKKGFAAGANREVIQNGCDMMGAERDYVIEQTLIAMQGIAEQLGL